VLHGAQSLITQVQPIPPRPLTKDEKKEATAAAKEIVCIFCAGIHAGPSSPACPRLASGKLNGDGNLTEFTYWADKDWEDSRVNRVVFLEDVAEEDEDDEPAPA
jgi:hypothetical protein